MHLAQDLGSEFSAAFELLLGMGRSSLSSSWDRGSLSIPCCSDPKLHAGSTEILCPGDAGQKPHRSLKLCYKPGFSVLGVMWGQKQGQIKSQIKSQIKKEYNFITDLLLTVYQGFKARLAVRSIQYWGLKPKPQQLLRHCCRLCCTISPCWDWNCLIAAVFLFLNLHQLDQDSPHLWPRPCSPSTVTPLRTVPNICRNSEQINAQ